jgi:hypothetical protein
MLLVSGAKVQIFSLRGKEIVQNLSLEGKEKVRFLSLKDKINDKRQ